MESIQEDAHLIIHEKKISSMKDLLRDRADSQERQAAFDHREEWTAKALATLSRDKLVARCKSRRQGRRASDDRRQSHVQDMHPHGAGPSPKTGIQVENVRSRPWPGEKEFHHDKDNTTVVEGKGKTAR